MNTEKPKFQNFDSLKDLFDNLDLINSRNAEPVLTDKIKQIAIKAFVDFGIPLPCFSICMLNHTSLKHIYEKGDWDNKHDECGIMVSCIQSNIINKKKIFEFALFVSIDFHDDLGFEDKFCNHYCGLEIVASEIN